MSKKINTEELNRKKRECNANAMLVNMVNRSGAELIENGTMTREMYVDIIDANVSHGNKNVATVEYGSGYLDGYRDCQKDSVNTVLATVAGCAIGLGVIKYRKEIKAYGKYVIGKLTKREDK